MEGVPELQPHSFECLSNVTKRCWRLNCSVAFQKRPWEDTSKLNPNPGSVPDCCLPLNAGPEELLCALQHLQERDPDGAMRGHCQQHVQWYVGTSLCPLLIPSWSYSLTPALGRPGLIRPLLSPTRGFVWWCCSGQRRICLLLFSNLALVWKLREISHFSKALFHMSVHQE